MGSLRWMLLVLLGFFLVSCGRDSSGKMHIAYIAKNSGNPYFGPLIAGIQKAADENGAVFSNVSPSTADATSQLNLIKDQIQRGVKVLVISPNSPDALNLALKDAMDHGITVITVDSDLTGHEDFRTAGVLTVDPQTVGESQVELMGSLINYEGKFAILSATIDAPNQNAWIDVMKKTLAANPKYAKMQLVKVAYGDDLPEKSTSECEALLLNYPDLKGILAPTTVGIARAAQCVESKGRAGQVQVTGLGMPSEMRGFIKDGTVKAFALWNPYDEGYLAGTLGIKVAKGEVKPAAGTKFQAGTLGEREIREKNIVITGPPLTFTKDNIDQFKF